MTSANPPSEPIAKDNDDAISKLGSIVDYFLVHDREIAHRSDDSVLRVNSEAPILIRRSRDMPRLQSTSNTSSELPFWVSVPNS